MSTIKYKIKECISKLNQKDINTIRLSDPPEYVLNFHTILKTTLIDLDKIKLNVKDSEFISEVLFFLKYNLTPYLNENIPIALTIAIDCNSHNIEDKILTLSLLNNEKIFKLEINILTYNKNEFINILSESLFEDFIYQYTNFENYLNKIFLINNIKEIFNLSDEDTNLIHNCLNKNYNKTMTRSLIFCNDYTDNFGCFYIMGFNNAHIFEIKFNEKQVTISFLNIDVTRDYILLPNSNLSFKEVQNDIYEKLSLSEFGYSSFYNVLDLLKIKSIVNY